MKKLFILMLAAGMFWACSNNQSSSTDQDSTTDKSTQINENQMIIETDMENVASLPAYWINSKSVEKMDIIPAHSGNYAVKVDAENKYSLTFRENFSNLNAKLPKRVVVNGWYYFPEANEKSSIVMDINDNNTTTIWKSFKLIDANPATNQWNEFTAYFTIDQPIKPGQQIKIFASSGGKLAYFDDFRITFEY